jgi:uncharacterized membrane protein
VLLVVVYFIHPGTFLVDPSVTDLESWEAIVIAVGGLVVAWVVYDELCRLLGTREWALAASVFAFVCLSAWAAGELFAARAAYIEVGAMLGTIMVANVFFVIIPAHWELVRAKQEGREPDPSWNERGKQRSVHNNYFTLPVLLAMLSAHFPFTYGADYAWLVLVALMALGAWTRHFFNLRHRGVNAWWIPVSAAAGVLVLAILLRPEPTPSLASGGHGSGPRPTFAEVQSIVNERCVPCHATNPTQPGFAGAPGGGIVLETRRQIEDNALLIKAVVVDTRAMPLANATRMTDEERATLAGWIASR